jgi:hypothetical protein
MKVFGTFIVLIHILGVISLLLVRRGKYIIAKLLQVVLLLWGAAEDIRHSFHVLCLLLRIYPLFLLIL